MQGRPWLILLCGHPYTGKSTLAKKLKRSDKEVIISSDEKLFAKMHKLNISYQKAFHEYYDEAKSECLKDFQLAVLADQNVIVDRTNMYPETRQIWLENLPGHYQRVAVVCSCNEQQLAKRMQQSRLHAITLDTIIEAKAKFIPPTKEEGFDEILSASDIYDVI